MLTAKANYNFYLIKYKTALHVRVSDVCSRPVSVTLVVTEIGSEIILPGRQVHKLTGHNLTIAGMVILSGNIARCIYVSKGQDNS